MSEPRRVRPVRQESCKHGLYTICQDCQWEDDYASMLETEGWTEEMNVVTYRREQADD